MKKNKKQKHRGTTATHKTERPGIDHSLIALRSNKPCPHLNFTFLATRTWDKKFLSFKHPGPWGSERMDTGASAATLVLMAQGQRPQVSWHSSQCPQMVPMRLTERNPETTDIPTVQCSNASCFILDFYLRFHRDQSSLWSGCHPSASLNAGFEIRAIWSTSLVILAFLLWSFLLGKFSPGKPSLLSGFPEVASTQTFCSDILWFCERGSFALVRHASLFHGAGSCFSTGALFLKKEEDRVRKHHMKCTISGALHMHFTWLRHHLT